MTALTQFLDRRAPIRVTEYKNGSGVHEFHPRTKSWQATIVGGGGGAGRAVAFALTVGAAGGSAAATLYVEDILKTGQTSIEYIVGAPGLAGPSTGNNGTSGGFSQLGPFRANPGLGGLGDGSNSETIGGLVSADYINTSYSFISMGSVRGVPGGWGGRASSSSGGVAYPGGAPGYPTAVGYAVATFISKVQRGSASGGGPVGGYYSGGGGGDSTMGRGGAGGDGGSSPGVGQDATGYGAGGGAGGSRSLGSSGLSGDGTGGYILIREFAD